jgi:hypothetical protein
MRKAAFLECVNKSLIPPLLVTQKSGSIRKWGQAVNWKLNHCRANLTFRLLALGYPKTSAIQACVAPDCRKFAAN